MFAILSDVHANLEALTAVLDVLERVGATAVYNLGDTLGYGPNPVECLDLARGMGVVLMGNFDYAVLHTPDGFGHNAERSILWTQGRLAAAPEPADRAAFLAGLPRSHRAGDALFVHGSARNPLHEYLYPEDVYNEPKMARIAAVSGPLCFGGHTHVPGVFVEQTPGRWEFLAPEECGGFPVAGRRVIANVGSVGQPRDDDPRACYALFDGERVVFRRIAYDVEATVRKIRAIPELDDFLGDRLREGR